MKCKVNGCDKDAMYKEQQVCQMHYFRYMRNGDYEIHRSRKYRISNPAGYQKIYEPCHELADSTGYVYEHRFVSYVKNNGIIDGCEICGKKITWETCHIDHVDTDVTNNKPDNLRQLCSGCNVFRGHTAESMGNMMLTVNGKTLTPSAWARMNGVEVTSSTIRRRKLSGMSDYDAIFAPRKTHHNTKTKKHISKTDSLRGIK